MLGGWIAQNQNVFPGSGRWEESGRGDNSNFHHIFISRIYLDGNYSIFRMIFMDEC